MRPKEQTASLDGIVPMVDEATARVNVEREAAHRRELRERYAGQVMAYMLCRLNESDDTTEVNYYGQAARVSVLAADSLIAALEEGERGCQP